MILRPKPKNNSGLVFNLQSVECVNATSKYEKDLWLFGNTRDNNSVALKVTDFKPWLYILPHKEADPVEFMEEYNNETYGNVIVAISNVQKKIAPGFNYNKTTNMWKVTYKNLSNLRKLKEHIKENDMCLKVFNDDFGGRTMFLSETGLKMQRWIKVSHIFRSTKLTCCQIEGNVQIKSLTSLDLNEPAPFLLMTVRLRPISSISTKKSQVFPDPKKQK